MSDILLLQAPPGTLSTESKQDATIAALASVEEKQESALFILSTLLKLLANPPYIDRSANQIRAQITGSLTAVTTITTVTGLTNIDGYQGKLQVINQNNGAWAQVVRSRIS